MKKIKKEDCIKYIKSFVKWLLTNTLWTIVSLIVPFTLLIPFTKDIFKSISTKTYTIKIYHIFWIILFCLIEGIIVYLFICLKYRRKNSNLSLNSIERSEKIDYNLLDYYFEEYHKHLTVYKNGNGILINSFTVVINNINSITEFKRELNIKDAKVTTVFPKLKEMHKTNLNDRFSKFGFWYKCLNNNNLIKSVGEYYWSKDNRNIDTVSQADPKVLKWIMEMNPSSIEIGKPYNIVYVISVPGMFPIENGFFSENISSIKGTKGKFNSRFNIKHQIKHLKYTVSFENGLKLFQKPCGIISLHGNDINLNYQNDNNIIFDKYIFNAENPECDSIINIEWKFTEKYKRGKKRRTHYENMGRN